MDATQAIQDFPFDDEEEDISEDEEETQPVAKLKVFKNEHIPETELLLYPGENIVGRDGAFCTVPLPAPSMSKRHATISITVFRSNGQHSSEATETLIWDMGSLNGTRKGRLKLKPNVRYALTEGDKVTLADLPCQYVALGAAEGERGKGEAGTADCLAEERGEETNMPKQQSCEVKLRTEMGAEAEREMASAANGERGCLTPRREQGGAELRGSQEVSPRPLMAELKDQTPTPLVPESDAESDEERKGWRPRAVKSLVSSDSDSPRIPQPICSTFQSPSGASYIPESPSSSVRGRVNETVSSGGSIWTDRSTEAAPKKPRPDPLELNMDSDTDVEGEERAGAVEEKKSSPRAANGEASVNLVARGSARPATKHLDFGTDSDTDAEVEERKASDMNSTKASVGEVGQKPSSPAAAAAPPDFHLESDTDEDEVPHTAHPAPGGDVAESRTANMASAELHMDSDTDMEEEGEQDDQADASAASPVVAQVEPENHQSRSASDSADTTDPFKSESSKTAEACLGQQPKPAAALEIQSDSDTDVEDEDVRQTLAPSNTSGSPRPSGLQPVPEVAHGAQGLTAAPGAGAESDQDTDVEEGVAGLVGGKRQALPPAVTPTNPDDFNMDSDTDVEEEVKEEPSLRKPGRERAFAAGVQSSTPVGAGLRLEEMETQLFLSPSDQFSRPLVLPPLHPVVPSEDSPDDDDFIPETQSFVAEPEGRDVAGVRALDETSLEDTELSCTGGEMGRSPQLQLGMSDSSRLQQLASEPTQAYTFPGFRDYDDSERDLDLDATQDYGALQATQAYVAEQVGGEEEGPHVDSATAETQAFFMVTTARSPEIAISSAEAMPPPQSNAPQGVARPEEEEEATQLTETDVYSHLTTVSTADTLILHQSQKSGGEEAGRTSGATSTDQLTNSTPCEPRQANVPVAEFHMDSDTDLEEEEDGGSKEPQFTTGQIKAEELQLHSDSDTDDEDDPFKPAMTTTPMTSSGGQKSHTTANNNCAETQPMSAINDEEEEEEPKVAPMRKRNRMRRGQGHLDRQPSETLLIAETQPIAMNDGDKGNDGDDVEVTSRPESPKRRGKASRGKGRQAGDEGGPVAVSSSCLTTDQTQPMAGVDVEDEEEEVMPVGPRRRGRARQGKGTQAEDGSDQINLSLSVAETQPLSAAFDDDENSEEETEPRAASSKQRGRSRKGKGQQEQEESKPAEMPSNTQPLAACEQEEEEEEEHMQAAPSTSRAKTRRAGKEPVPTRSTRGQGATELEQQGEEVEEEASVESRRQTRGKTPAVKRGGRRRGEAEAEKEKEAEEKSVQEVRRGRGRKSVVQQRQDQEEIERLEREKNQQEKERMEREQREQEEREEKKRQEEERLHRERSEEMERLEREMKENEEKEEREKEEKERKEREEKERLEKERIEKERQEKEERERMERERKETEEGEKLEKERLEKEREEKEERERTEKEQREKEEKEKKEQEDREKLKRELLEKERQEKEEQERLKKEREQREKKEAKERERMEKERLEKERQEKKEKEKIERRREKEEKERKEAEERDRLEKERLEKQRKEEEEKERQEAEKRKEEEEREREKKESKGRFANRRKNTEPSETVIQENDAQPQASTRGRPAVSRRTAPAPPSGQEEPVLLPSNDCPARRTRSRSSSSNSVSSERSTSSVRSSASTSRQGAPESHAPSSRRSSRRPATGAPPAGKDAPAQEDGSSQSQSGRSSRRLSTSSNSVCSEVPEAASVVSQSRGRGRGRGRKSMKGKEPGPEPELEPASSEPQVEEPPVTKTAGRGRRGRKAGAGDVVADGDMSAQANSEDRPAEAEAGPAPRGRRGAKAPKPEPGATGEGSQTDASGGSLSEACIPQETTGKGHSRGQRVGVSQSTSAEDSKSASANNGDISTVTSQGRGKRRSQNDKWTEELDESEEIRFKIPRLKGKAPKGAKKGEDEDSAGGVEPEKKEEEEETAPGPAQRKGKGRQSVSQKKKEVKKEVEENEEAAAGTSTSSITPPLNEPEAQEASDKASRKRGTGTADSPTPAKSARRSMGTSRQAHKVLFTGVSDESGEAVVARLGGSMAKGVSDMTHLVTDAVRRTVKFMCAVAKGVPIVTPDWLKKSGKAGSFLPTDEFLVKDPDQEKKFNFRLKESLSVACNQPLLQGYEIHVTRSVKPEPAQMKDIITSCGAHYLPRMPSVNKPQTVVVSCAEDAALCSPALAASLPVVTSEFLLTGILRQQTDVVTHALSIRQVPARGRKKT